MSREIKFRAKSLKTNEFVFGFFGQRTETSPVRETTQTYTINYILVDNGFCGFEEIEIDPKTLGEYTGLLDKNGKEIYEGDILRINHGDNDGDTYEVIFKEGCYWGKCIYTLRPSTTPDKTLLGDLDYWEPQSKEIIGNIYENPELITGVKNV